MNKEKLKERVNIIGAALFTFLVAIVSIVWVIFAYGLIWAFGLGIPFLIIRFLYHHW